jgi:putative acetyltransferase
MSDGAMEAARARRVGRRAATDTPALMELWLASWRATYADIDFDARLEWFKARLAALEAGGALTLCLYEDAPTVLAGFVVIHPETGWLDQLCVHPNCFGAGAARALIEAAREASPNGIRLDVNADNTRARRFYEREGFSLVGAGAISCSGRATVVLEWRPNCPADGK